MATRTRYLLARVLVCASFAALLVPLTDDCFLMTDYSGNVTFGRLLRRDAPLWSPCTGQAQGTAPTRTKSDIVDLLPSEPIPRTSALAAIRARLEALQGKIRRERFLNLFRSDTDVANLDKVTGIVRRRWAKRVKHE
jgi:hypothetical protein